MQYTQYMAALDTIELEALEREALESRINRKEISRRFDYYGIANELAREIGAPTIRASALEESILEAYEQGFLALDESDLPTSQSYCEDLAHYVGAKDEMWGVINDYLCDACYSGEQDRARLSQ